MAVGLSGVAVLLFYASAVNAADPTAVSVLVVCAPRRGIGPADGARRRKLHRAWSDAHRGHAWRRQLDQVRHKV